MCVHVRACVCVCVCVCMCVCVCVCRQVARHLNALVTAVAHEYGAARQDGVAHEYGVPHEYGVAHECAISAISDICQGCYICIYEGGLHEGHTAGVYCKGGGQGVARYFGLVAGRVCIMSHGVTVSRCCI